MVMETANSTVLPYPSHPPNRAPWGKGHQEFFMVEKAANISDVMNFDWYANEDLVQKSLNMLIQMVSLNNSYVNSCFNMLVKCFMPKEQETRDPKASKYDVAFTEKVASLAHSTIKSLLFVVPLSVNSLYQSIKENYPHRRYDATVQWMFLKQVLMVTQYCPSIVEQILGLCVDKTISIDVEIKLEELPEEEEDLALQFAVEIDQMTMDPTKEDANKLDGMMSVLFQYVDVMLGGQVKPIVRQENPLLRFPSFSEVPISPDQFFTSLLHVFDRIVLNTHKSKYTQFLMFYTCRLSALGTSQSYSQRFIVHLIGKLLDISTSKYVRLAAAAYLGSYSSRAQYLPINLVKDTLTVFMEWAIRYLNTIESHTKNTQPNSHQNNTNNSNNDINNSNTSNDLTIDVELHGLFYMVSQSLFYIFCFHHRELAAVTNLDNFAGGFQRVSESALNPFKVCLPTVVREFSRIVGTLKWFNAEDIVQRNEKIVLPTRTSFGGINQLESFFPFDPYLLRHSSRYITELYNVWNGGEDEEMEESDDEEDTQGSFSTSEHSLSYHSAMNTPVMLTPPRSKKTTSNNEQEEDVMMSFTPEVEHDLRYHFSFD